MTDWIMDTEEKQDNVSHFSLAKEEEIEETVMSCFTCCLIIKGLFAAPENHFNTIPSVKMQWQL